MTSLLTTEKFEDPKFEEIDQLIYKLKGTSNRRKQDKFWYRNERLEAIIKTALTCNDTECLNYLINEHELNPNIKIDLSTDTKKKFVPLIYFAVINDNLGMVSYLVEKGANITPCNPYDDVGDDLAIRIAIKRGFASIVDYLLDHGATPNGLFSGIHPHTFLGKAAVKEKRLEVVDVLISHGADIDFTIKELYRRYRYAKMHSLDFLKEKKTYLQAIKVLLDFSSGNNFTDLRFLRPINDISGLNFLGISLNRNPITRKYLKKKKFKGTDDAIISIDDLNKLQGKRRLIIDNKMGLLTRERGLLRTSNKEEVDVMPLLFTVDKGPYDAIKLRLNFMKNDLKKDLNEYYLDGSHGYTLFHVGIHRGSLDIVKLLLEFDLNPNLPYYDGGKKISNIEYAQSMGFLEIASYLSSISSESGWESDPQFYKKND